MKKTIYIAGKVTGLLAKTVQVKFKTAQNELEEKGFDVVNPVVLINNPNEDWDVAMNKCIEALQLCDAIVLLPCWQDSKGACIEQKLAQDLEIPIFNYSKYGLEVLNKNLV